MHMLKMQSFRRYMSDHLLFWRIIFSQHCVSQLQVTVLSPVLTGHNHWALDVPCDIPCSITLILINLVIFKIIKEIQISYHTLISEVSLLVPMKVSLISSLDYVGLHCHSHHFHYLLICFYNLVRLPVQCLAVQQMIRAIILQHILCLELMIC